MILPLILVLGVFYLLMSQALDNLNANVAELSGKVDVLLAKPTGVPEADVQASADAVKAISDKIPA